MKKTLQISNILAFTFVLIVNYLSNTGYFNNQTIADVSDQYQSLITPAKYTFAIWGLIYLLLLGFVIYQARSLFFTEARDDFVLDVGVWFIISCTANALWVVTWLYEYLMVSVLIMLILLFSLFRIIIRNRMELYDAPLPILAFLWWPFVVYSGWITVATLVNISAFLVNIEWNGWGLSPEAWSIVMILLAAIANILAIYKRNLREFAAAGIWALIGIAVANWNEHTSIQYTAVGTSVILITLAGIHGYKNFETNPVNKLLNRMRSHKTDNIH